MQNKNSFQNKYPTLYRWSTTSHDLGHFRYAETDSFDRLVDRILNGNKIYNFFYNRAGQQNARFINISPFFNNVLVQDPSSQPFPYLQVSSFYLHPKITEELNYFNSSKFNRVLTPSFRPLQLENMDFFAKHLEDSARNPDKFTTGRKIVELISNVFTGPDSKYVPDPLSSTLLIDKAYVDALSRSAKNSPFSHVTLDEFFYTLSAFDRNGSFADISKQANVDYETVLKLNYFFSIRNFEQHSLDDFKIKPARIWYEQQFRNYLFSLFDYYYLSSLSYRNKIYFTRRYFGGRSFRLRPRFRFKTKLDSATFFYPSLSLRSPDELPIANENFYPYKSVSNFFDSENFSQQGGTVRKNPLSARTTTIPNLFKHQFSELYNHHWDFKSQTFANSHKIYPTFKNIELKNLPVSKLPSTSLLSELHFETDDLDRLFISAYSSKLDSSHIIYKTLQNYPDSDFSTPFFYKSFAKINSDFLSRSFYSNNRISNSPEFSLFFKSDSILSPTGLSKYNTNLAYTNLRRFQNPFESTNSRPHLRSLFQPSPRYRYFFHHQTRSFKSKYTRPFARRRNSVLQTSKTAPSSPSDIYFYFFDPSISFNKEYSSFYFKNDRSFKLSSNSFFDTIYSRRNLPFRFKYKYSDRQKRDYFFGSKFSARTPVKSPRRKVFSTYRYNHSFHRLKIKRRPTARSEDDLIKDELELRHSFFTDYLYESIFSAPVKFFVDLFDLFILKPTNYAVQSIIRSDNVFSVIVISLVFYFFDYVVTIVYIYFPGGLIFFDYSLFNFSFHFAYISLLIVSVIAIFFAMFQLTSLTTTYNSVSFIRSLSLVSFHFFIELFLILLICFILAFPYVQTNAHRFFFFLSFFIFFSFYLINTFFQFFIQFNRYSYVPSVHVFFPYPLFYQRFGYYRIHFFLSLWPNRFRNIFSHFNSIFLFSTNWPQQLGFQRSFFFIKVGSMTTTPYRSMFKNKAYSLYHLFFPLPTYGPNVFESYSYYQDLINRTSLPRYSMPEDDSEFASKVEDIEEDTVDQEGSHTRFTDLPMFKAEQEENLRDPKNSETQIDWEDTEYDANSFDIAYGYKSDFDSQKSSRYSIPKNIVRRTNAYNGKSSSQIVFDNAHAEDPFQAVFDERLENLEIDPFDEQFTSEASTGFWYPFQLARSSSRFTPPAFFNFHTRPLDPVFRHTQLLPFLFSLKLYKTETTDNSWLFMNDLSKSFSFYSFFFKRFLPNSNMPIAYIVVNIFFFPVKFLISIAAFFISFFWSFYSFLIFSKSPSPHPPIRKKAYFLITYFFIAIGFSAFINTKKLYLLYRRIFNNSLNRPQFNDLFFHLTILVLANLYILQRLFSSEPKRFISLISGFSRSIIYRYFF